MKKVLLFLFFALFITHIQAQCTESFSGFGNSPDGPSYHIKGDVSVTLNTNNTLTLNLESNFSTLAGPDVHAYLVASDGKTDEVLTTTLIADLNHIDFGLTQASGKQSFTVDIPSDKDITKFDKIFFYCLAYDHFWDLGTFTPFNSNSCAVLEVDRYKMNTIQIYPNPAKNTIQISNVADNSVEIRIFNVLGKQVFYQPKTTAKTINIATLVKGVYVAKITVDGSSKTQKLLIQ